MSDIKLKTLEIEDLGTYTVENKAEIDGNYDELTSGTAKAVLSTTYESDSEPYNFRRSKSNGNRKSVEKLIGGTIAWNQLVQNGDFAENISHWGSRQSGGFEWDNGKGKLTALVTSNNNWAYQYINLQKDHCYIVTFKASKSADSSFGVLNIDASNSSYALLSRASTELTTAEAKYGVMLKPSADASRLGFSMGTSVAVNSVVYLDDVNCFDLTAKFGSAIADYIYSLETATAGAGVAWFKKYFPKDYYAYCEPTFLHSKISAMETVGFNAWDEEWEVGRLNADGTPVAEANRIRSKNYIKVLPNTIYHIRANIGGGLVCFYNENKESIGYVGGLSFVNGGSNFTTLSETAYIKFCTYTNYGGVYNNDICINISDPTRNGTYEPYKKHVCAVDNIDLKGIFKLDSNNELYAEGDTYEPSGEHTEKFYEELHPESKNWGVYSSGYPHLFYYVSTNAKHPNSTELANMMVAGYTVCPSSNIGLSGYDGKMCAVSPEGRIYINDPNYTDVTAFANSLVGKTILYELATPTVTEAEPYQQIQVVDTHGTESMVDERDVAVPMGHETHYYEDIAKKVSEMLPNPPSANGTYSLKATVSASGVTYSWQA